MLARKPHTIDNLIIHTIEQDGQIIDIEVLVREEKRAEFLQCFAQKDIAWNCYTGMFKAKLTSYFFDKKFSKRQGTPVIEKKVEHIMQCIEKCLGPFSTLEHLINNPLPQASDDAARLWALSIKVKSCFEQIKAVLSEDSNLILAELIKKLEENTEEFLGNIIELQRKKNLTAEELQQLFCIQDGAVEGSTQIMSLGSFMAVQMSLIAEYGMKAVYDAVHNRIHQAFLTHSAIKALSDAKAALEVRALAAKGARKESSLPVPIELIEVIAVDREEKKSTPEVQKWLSLKPYVSQLNDVEEINKMIHLLAEKKVRFQEVPVHWLSLLGLFSSSIIEVPISLLHIILSLFSFIGEGLCWAPNLFFESNLNMAWLDEFATQLHYKLSFVIWGKKKSRENYTKNYPSTQSFLDYLSTRANCFPQLDLSDDITGQPLKIDPDNSLNLLLSAYSGHKVARMVGDWLVGIYNAFKEVGKEFIFVFFSTQEARDNAFKKQQKNIADKWAVILEKFIGSQQNFVEPQLEKQKEQKAEEKTEEKTYGSWVPGKAWAMNEFHSPGDPFGDIMSGMADFIGFMFRHNAGFATVGFGLSVTSLAVLLTPLSTAPGTAWLGWTAGWLSKNFTGKAISEGMFTKLVAVFLQWKVIVLTLEAGLELSEGNIVFLRSFCKNLDQTALVMLVLIAGGYSLQIFDKYPIPTNFQLLDPSLHPGLFDKYLNLSVGILTAVPTSLNHLGRESAICNAGGQFVLKQLENLVLGAKLGLIVISALGQTHIAKDLDVVKLVAELSQEIKRIPEDKRKDDQSVALTMKKLLAKHGIYPPKPEEPALEKYETMVNQMISAVLTHDYKPKKNITAKPKLLELARHAAKPTEEEKEKKLREAIHLVKEMELLARSGFKNQYSAWHFSDYLHNCFDDYIATITDKNKKEHFCYLKKCYLANFNNQYCNSEIITLAKFFSIVPFYPLTLIWRAIKYCCSGSAYIQEDVLKSFSKDAAIFMQIFTDFLRPFRELARAVSYILRLALGTIAIILATIFVFPVLFFLQKMSFSAMCNSILEMTTVISLHRLNLTGWLRAKYAKISRNSNINPDPDYLRVSGDQVLNQMQENSTSNKENKNTDKGATCSSWHTVSSTMPIIQQSKKTEEPSFFSKLFLPQSKRGVRREIYRDALASSPAENMSYTLQSQR